MKRVAIIPARGGSERIPRKNIRPFCGQPIIAYSISAAQQTDLFDAVIVSTEDAEIAKIAESYGAEVPFLRPANIADNTSGVMEVTAHALRMLDKENLCPAEVCMIYATAPLMHAQDIMAGYEKFRSCGRDFVFSATEFEYSIFRSFAVQPDETPKMFWPENYKKNSQDLTAAYHDAAQFFWGRRTAILEKDAVIFSERSAVLLMPRHRVVDIDTPEDWHRAELLYQALQKQQHEDGKRHEDRSPC